MEPFRIAFQWNLESGITNTYMEAFRVREPEKQRVFHSTDGSEHSCQS